MYIHDVRITQAAKGALSYFPPVYRFGRRFSATSGTDSPSYCYSVWLRHFCTIAQHGLSTEIHSIAELGPGDSLGIGLCALLTGAETYYALDSVKYSDVSKNISVFEDLIGFFARREPIPHDSVSSDVAPKLEDYSFPHDLLDEQRLKRCLDPQRLDRIRHALQEEVVSGDSSPSIVYVVPWYDSDLIETASVDLVFSQAVLEHVDELSETYQAMSKWLKPGGISSHVIDFRSHGTTREWNGHWRIPKRVWEGVIRGKRYYLINRQPYSAHKRLLTSLDFEIAHTEPARARCSFDRKELSPEFRDLSAEDLSTSGVYVLAQKPPLLTGKESTTKRAKKRPGNLSGEPTATDSQTTAT